MSRTTTSATVVVPARARQVQVRATGPNGRAHVASVVHLSRLTTAPGAATWRTTRSCRFAAPRVPQRDASAAMMWRPHPPIVRVVDVAMTGGAASSRHLETQTIPREVERHPSTSVPACCTASSRAPTSPTAMWQTLRRRPTCRAGRDEVTSKRRRVAPPLGRAQRDSCSDRRGSHPRLDESIRRILDTEKGARGAPTKQRTARRDFFRDRSEGAGVARVSRTRPRRDRRRHLEPQGRRNVQRGVGDAQRGAGRLTHDGRVSHLTYHVGRRACRRGGRGRRADGSGRPRSTRRTAPRRRASARRTARHAARRDR